MVVQTATFLRKLNLIFVECCCRQSNSLSCQWLFLECMSFACAVKGNEWTGSLSLSKLALELDVGNDKAMEAGEFR